MDGEEVTGKYSMQESDWQLAAVIDNSADLKVMHLKKARRDAGGCGCVQTGD